MLIAIILAGGYATRLRALGSDVAKPLHKVAGHPIIEHIFAKVKELEELQQITISTNKRFLQQFTEWLDESNNHGAVSIIAEDSRSEEEKPGAVAALAQICSGTNDDCLIIAGDNLFTSSLRPMLQTFKSKNSPVVALFDVGSRELVKQYSAATCDSKGRIIRYVEKPTEPETTLIGTCIYMLPARTLGRLGEYVAQETDRDAPGRFISWLIKREAVYGQILDGYWWDIGTVGQYLTANEGLTKFLAAAGQPDHPS